MSFGFGIGDFITVFELVNRIRTKWVDAPSEYASIKNETKLLESILRDVGELGTEIDLTQEQENGLQHVIRVCFEVLEELDGIIEKYSSLSRSKTTPSTRVRRAWVRIKLDPSDIRHVRDRMTSIVTQLNALQEAIQIRLVNDVADDVQDLLLKSQSQEKNLVADWYAPSSFASHLQDHLNRRQIGTGSWFLEDDRYKTWRQGKGITLLCPGIPGSGKSTMAAAIVDDIRTYFDNQRDVVVAYIFCNFNRQSQQELNLLLASLTRQLFQQQSSLDSEVSELYMRHRDLQTRPSTDQLTTLLHHLVSQYEKVFILIDALDELDNLDRCRDKLLDILFALVINSKQRLSLLATTRVVPNIMMRFPSCEQVEISAHENDISNYLDARMPELRLSKDRITVVQSEIRSRIVESAQGMFLLAKLHFESLLDCTSPRAVRRSLENLPRGDRALSAAYDQAVERIDHQLLGLRQLAHRVLTWITYANRELSIGELQEAVAVTTDTTKLDHDDDLDDASEMLSVCAGLVVMDSDGGTIRLVHYTTQEYLKAIRDDWLLDGQRLVTQSCVTYLGMQGFEAFYSSSDGGLNDLQLKYKFLSYAIKNWGHHMRELGDEGVERMALGLLKDTAKLEFISRLMGLHSLIPTRSVRSPLHLCAHFGLCDLAQRLLDDGTDVNTTDARGKTALTWAILKGRTSFVQMLLALPDILADKTSPGVRSPLFEAARIGNTEMAKLLMVRPDVDVNFKDGQGETPLLIATRGRHIEIVRLLLTRNDVAINATNDALQSPLSLAVTQGDVATVTALLQQPEIAINSRHKNGWTPIHLAALSRKDRSVALLLSHPDVKIDLLDSGGNSVLDWAIVAGATQVVEVLLAHDDIASIMSDELSLRSLREAAQHDAGGESRKLVHDKCKELGLGDLLPPESNAAITCSCQNETKLLNKHILGGIRV